MMTGLKNNSLIFIQNINKLFCKSNRIKRIYNNQIYSIKYTYIYIIIFIKFIKKKNKKTQLNFLKGEVLVKN